ncbi:MAG: DNA translocase FtsK 4TM domain-containing protein [Acutalibacteraceae bacterium]|nr:DNA translocase FtsK 4TM domain-containing protein [Acutalibacteraceae bacterium]
MAEKEKETKKKKESKKNPEEQAKLSSQAKSIIFFGCALLLTALVLYKGENVWTIVHNFFKGIFGVFAITLPALLMYIGVITAKDKKVSGGNIGKIVLGAIAVILLSNCVYLFGSNPNAPKVDYFTRLGQLYTDTTKGYVNGSATGILGGLLGYPLAYLFGFTASKLLCIVLLVVDIMFMFGITVKDIYNVAVKIFTLIKNSIKQCDFTKEPKEESPFKRLTDTLERVKGKSNSKKKPTLKKQAKPTLDKENNDENDDYGDSYVDLNEISSTFNTVKNAKQEKAKALQEDDDYFDDEITPTNKEELLETVEKGNSSDKKASILDMLTKPENDDEPKGKRSKKQELAQAEAEISKQVSENQDSTENTSYCYPPIELLYPSGSKEDNQKAMEELERNGTKLESTLKSFGVNASIVNICRGPSVTRFEVQPAPGVKISKITNLADDISLNLASSGVRIEAPIPGKPAVGIEVPNKVITMVTMRELIDSAKFKKAKSKLSVVLGKDISGNTIVTDLAKMPHLLIAGTTGSGKSVCVNSILISLLYKATPDEVKLLLIDPKMVEFSKYKGIPHLLIPVVTDPKKAAGALNWAVNEMENRYKVFSTFGVRDIGGYNEMIDSYNKIRAERTPEELEEEPLVNDEGIPIPSEKMASIVIAIDEFADLMMTAPNEVEDSICRLAQKARAAGMHLVVATQRPTVNVITGVIKANIPSRISLKVSSQLDSRTILDVGGAEKLIGKGDMLFAPIGAPKPTRVQGCYASDSEIENVTSYIKKDHSSQYDVQIEEEIEKITELELSKSSKDKDSTEDMGGGFSDDSMMEEAIKLVVENGQASTSLLQRRLRLGYARAGRLIDEMEQMGIVGPHVGSKSREVLLTYQQWLERKNNMSD